MAEGMELSEMEIGGILFDQYFFNISITVQMFLLNGIGCPRGSKYASASFL